MFTSIKQRISQAFNEKGEIDLASKLCTIIAAGFILNGIAATLLLIYQVSHIEQSKAANHHAQMQIEMRFKDSLRDGKLVEASAQSVTTSYVLGAELDDTGQMVCVETKYEIEPYESESLEGHWNVLSETQTSYYNPDCTGEGHTSAPITMRFEGNGLFTAESVTSRKLTAEAGEVSFSDPNDSWDVTPEEGGEELSERLKRLNADTQPQRLIFKTKSHYWIADFGNPTLY